MNVLDGVDCRYIAVEGNENTGKTTLIHLMSDRLESMGFNVKVVREPHYLRDLIKHQNNKMFEKLKYMLTSLELGIGIYEPDLNYVAEISVNVLKLLMEDRKRLINEDIMGHIWSDPYNMIISDRCVLSSYVYQYINIYRLATWFGARSKSQAHSIFKSKGAIVEFMKNKKLMPHNILILTKRFASKSESKEVIDTDEMLLKIIDSCYHDAIEIFKTFKADEISPYTKITVAPNNMFTKEEILKSDDELCDILGIKTRKPTRS